MSAASPHAAFGSDDATEMKRGLPLATSSGRLVLESAEGLDIPLELRILSYLVVIFLFLLFLISVLWDRYGKEIGELYTPNSSWRAGDHTDSSINDVADEYTVYQKLPTFFYEYTRTKKKVASKVD